MITSALTNLVVFLEKIKTETAGIDILKCEEYITFYRNMEDKKRRFYFDDTLEELANESNLTLSGDDVELLYNIRTKLNWDRGETQPLEGTLSGGCTFNGDIFLYADDFWENSQKKFSDNELPVGEKELTKMLRWYESPAHPNDALYTPMFGCVLYEHGQMPCQFYFYDSGINHIMNVHSFEGYIDAMVNSAAVYCWQYFYIDPELIIAKNKGYRPETQSVSYCSFYNPERRRLLMDNFTDIEKKLPAFYKREIRFWDEDKTIDRLDLIAEYLDRSVRILPVSFPFIDFTHHKNYHEKFMKLYEASKK